MDYQEYLTVYQKAVICGIRNQEEQITETEWMVLSHIAQTQIIRRLQRELGSNRQGVNCTPYN